jgi:uncharacterized DUF497 family protein
MNYSWDSEKSKKNENKHGYSFNQIDAFNWDMSICIAVQFVHEEERELWLGPIFDDLVTVVIVEKSQTDVRIISMRDATNMEINIWRQEFQNE